ncbi:MAG: hypothetical protein SWH54_02005 [Thermodesulfobacteriota bacterium]|nr:hypothetical protein [Thermodesulfobacteriota bacterium]
MKVKTLVCMLAILLINVAVLAAPPLDLNTIPPSLEPWKAWVLHGQEDRFCPVAYNNGEETKCLWPSRLNLELDADGGRFSQQWLVFTKDWVPLPGSQKIWPQNVKIDGKAATVVEKGGIPCAYMTVGQHLMEGIFAWDEMPEMIRIPEASGLVTLSINRKTVDYPLLDTRGRLWLQKRKGIQTKEQQTEVRIYRLINDTIPMRVTTHLKMNVSGQARKVKLEKILLKDFIPLRINSPLPARIGIKGELMIQARPGRWEIKIFSRSKNPVHRIRPEKLAYGQEIWAFKSQNHLRMVKTEGVQSVDPNQADLPSKWKKFPAFIINSGNVMAFKEIRRGDPDPAPDQIHLKRNWWLDFNGEGFTIQDRIHGTMSRQWYLAMNLPGILGRVSVDGTDQLITGQGKDQKPGVELRRGKLDLVAESRYETSTGRIPAVGWDHDFQSVSGSLNLPPGWRLLTAGGVDVMPGTWFQRWTLLDLFLALIISLTILKLWNWRWGLLALVTLAITYHEPGSPRIVWLHLLAASALVKFLPDGWVKRMAVVWRMASMVTLLVIAIPFMVQQVRWGIYPQLETHGTSRWFTTQRSIDSTLQADRVREKAVAPKKRKAVLAKRPYASSGAVQQKLDYRKKQAVFIQDPNALIQTGPGLPSWKWRSFAMRWNGPVNKDQQVRLWLLPPVANLILGLVRVLFLALLIFGLINFKQWKIKAGSFTSWAVILCVLLFPGISAGETKSDGYPSHELLQQLKERLLEKPDCLPECATSPKIEIVLKSNRLQILFSVHAAVKTAVPLPGVSAASWQPKQVLLDSVPAHGLARDKEGLLWIMAPKGIHTITITGNTPPENSFQILLPLKPHLGMIQSKDWDVQGVDNNGVLDESIKFTRQEKKRSKQQTDAAMTLEPFLHIKRVLSLGLNWQIRTTVSRMTPTGKPVVVSVPLITGESVTTAGIRVEKGNALVHLGPKMKEAMWISSLKQSKAVFLQAPKSVPWTETWVLDASPIWHCEHSGIPIIFHQDQSGLWRPQWQPWPGEQVTINISRPKAIVGQTMTIDETRLTFTPGKRFDKAAFLLKIRSSEGGQHKLTLPEDAKLQQVKMSGKIQPIKKQKHEVIIPIKPGKQSVNLQWHQSTNSSLWTRAPVVKIGKDAVNAEVIFQMPRNRWILMTTGPRLGPAVLFWSYVAVIILAAFGLGKVTFTPIKTHQWLLLGVGLTQVHPLAAIMIVGWLLALGLRQNHPFGKSWFSFNATQLILVAWTVAALIGLYLSIQKGLLGIPNMQIAGNGSSDFWLHWTQDRIEGTTPQPQVLSLPLFVFRILMLLWALWLAHSLLKWLRWGWQCFSKGGLWKKVMIRRRKDGGQPPEIPDSPDTAEPS